MDPIPLTLTALEIARAIGRTKQAVVKALDGIAPSGGKIVDGKLAAAWGFLQLPKRLQRQLETARIRGSFRTVSDLVSNPPRKWTPAVPIAALSDEERNRAILLREALRPALERKDSPLISTADLKRAGVDAYTRVFGQPITERHWWRLFQRTLARDNGFEEFEVLEIYVVEQPAPAPSSGTTPGMEPNLSELEDTLALVADPERPTVEEKDAVWVAVIEFLRRECNPEAGRRLKARVINFLCERAPWIGSGREAIRVNVGRKLAKADLLPNVALALRDGRAMRAEIEAAEGLWPQGDVDAIVWASVHTHGGRISEAVRALTQSRKLSEGTVARLRGPSVEKSYIPASLRNLVSPQVQALIPIHQGPRAARLVAPHIDRDYSKVSSMDQVQADDFTMPVYFYVPDGTGWFRLTRGQTLVAIDVRSQRVLSWVLIPSEQYNALSIRTLFARTFEIHGIPKSLYLERGIWKRSRIVAGANQKEGGYVSPAKTELGLKILGIEFTHALRPQAKTVEHVGALLQNRMHEVPGYCGRNERVDCPEITHRHKLEVDARRTHPREYFLSFEEWNAQLGEIVGRYNTERHGLQTRIIPGMSPEEAFEKFWPADELKAPCKFGPEARHLLAHVQKPVLCGANGISFEIGGERFRYFDAQTGERQGQQLLAWFNPDLPETCTFTNMRGRNPFTVERHTPADAFNAGEDLQREIQKSRSHAGAIKSRYNVLKAGFEQKFQRPPVDLATSELGQRLNAAEAGTRQRREDTSRRDRRISELAQRVGLPTNTRTSVVEKGLTRYEEFLAMPDETPEVGT